MNPLKLALPGVVIALVLGGEALAPSAQNEAKAPPPWELSRNRLEAAQQTCQALAQEYLAGKATVEQVNQWSRRWLDAQRDVNSKKAEQLAAQEAHVSRLKELARAAQVRFNAGKAPASEASAAEYYRYDAELNFSRTKSNK